MANGFQLEVTRHCGENCEDCTMAMLLQGFQGRVVRGKASQKQHLHEAARGRIVLAVDLQVCCELLHARRQLRDLHLRGAGVRLRPLELRHSGLICVDATVPRPAMGSIAVSFLQMTQNTLDFMLLHGCLQACCELHAARAATVFRQGCGATHWIEKAAGRRWMAGQAGTLRAVPAAKPARDNIKTLAWQLSVDGVAPR